MSETVEVPAVPLATDKAQSCTSARLFPWFICRLGSLPAHCVESLHSRNLEETLIRLHEVDKVLASTRQQVSDVLHELIGRVGDRMRKGHLLSLRRDLFNLRTPGRASVDIADAALPSSARELLNSFLAALSARKVLLASLRDSFENEVGVARQKLKQSLVDERFQRGLLLSSRSLFDAQGRYLKAKGEGLRMKDQKTEGGLLRYFCRTAMKATPFSTFCLVTAGRLIRPRQQDAGNPSLEFVGDPRDWRSLVRLNKKACGLIIHHALVRPTIRRHFGVELNPTIAIDGDRIVFLVVSHGRETFQRLNRVAAINVIMQALSERDHLRLDELVERIISHPSVEATAEQATKYVEKLLDIGFLRFHVGIRDQDPDWDIPLRGLLEPIADETAQAFGTLLGTLRTNVELYPEASLTECAKILAASQHAVVETFQRVGARGSILEVQLLPFLEDTASALRASLPCTEDVQQVLTTLVTFARLTRCIANYRQEQASMRHFFDTYYGSAIDRVPLLRFYEDFHREHLNEHGSMIEHARNANWAMLEGYDVDNPFRLEFIETVRDAKRAIVRLVSEHWSATPQADEIDIPAAELEGAVAGVPRPRASTGSVSFWVNYLRGQGEDERPRLLLDRPGYAPGYGKQFSRFLHLLPLQVYDDLRARNRGFGGDLLAEICGDANHNANLHPPILPYEINYPTGETGSLDHQIPALQLIVERDADDAHALVLRHGPSGRGIVPVDLGFLFKEDRPPLFQLLLRFTPLCDYVMILPDAPHVMPVRLRKKADRATTGASKPRDGWEPTGQRVGAAGASVSNPVVYRPRITFGGCIVLARRRWTVPPHDLPQQRGGETDCEFFVRADRWRRQYGMPRELFVRLQAVGHDSEGAKAGEPDDGRGREGALAERQTVHDRQPLRHQTRALLNLEKPQYVDFANPLLVSLFGRLAARACKFTATLEERYPPRQALPRIGNESFAAEQVLQIDFLGGGAI